MVRFLKRIFIFILPISLFILIIFLIINSNNKTINDEYYTILEHKSYVMKEDRNMYFSVYSKKSETLIEYKDENKYILHLDNLSYSLDVTDISSFEYKDYYIYKITSKMVMLPYSFASEATLTISNMKFSLNLKLGTISFLDTSEFELLSIDMLYASYSYVNDIKMLVGINLKLTNEYDFLKEVHLGNYAKGMLSKIIYDKEYDYEIEINKIIKNYRLLSTENNYIVGLQSKLLFIPIIYNKEYMIRESYITLNLDGINYYIDTFSYMVNDLKIEEYLKILTLGELKYV